MSLRNLKSICARRGVTREDVARHLGLSESMVRKMESGSRNINGEQLRKLSAFLECSTDLLLGLSDVEETASA